MANHLLPTLLGVGERLFAGVGDTVQGLEPAFTIAAPKVTHLKLVRRRGHPPACCRQMDPAGNWS